MLGLEKKVRKSKFDESDEFEAAMSSSEEKNRKRIKEIKSKKYSDDDDYPDEEDASATKDYSENMTEESADNTGMSAYGEQPVRKIRKKDDDLDKYQNKSAVKNRKMNAAEDDDSKTTDKRSGRVRRERSLDDAELSAIKSKYETERNRFYTYVKKSDRKIKTLRILNVIFVLLLIAAVGFIVAVATKEKGSEEAFFSNDTVAVNTTYKITDDLSSVVSGFSDDYFSGSVGKFNGYEYLVLSATVDDTDVKLCFQNEFPDEALSDSIAKSFIYSDGKVLVLNDSYDITNPSKLIPEFVKVDGSSNGLLYVTYDEGGTMPATLSLYNISSMVSCGSINLSTTFRYYFNAVCADDDNKYLQVTNSDITYTYAVNDTAYISVNNKGTSSLSFGDSFSYSIDGDALNFTSYVTVGDQEYLGEYSGTIAFTASGFNMSKQTFAAYVPFSYEDYDSDGIITPRTEPLTERIIISGKNQGKYALPYYSNIELSDVDYSQITEDASGIRSLTDSDSNVISYFGVDVSKYQEDVDWKAVADAGADFAFVRVAYRGYSEGKIVLDDYADANLKGAADAGLSVGSYIFTQAITTDEAVEEADTVIDKLQNLGINDGIIVFDTECYDDVEEARGNAISREERTEIAKAFCEEVTEAGYTPVIYANTRWFLLGIDMDELSDYDFWYAYYGDEPILPYKFALWQYSSSGTVAGIDNEVDMNIMFENIFE
jgi:GH25 family lysozyme M1 (1,4-beta-N-acetylmuramidase)